MDRRRHQLLEQSRQLTTLLAVRAADLWSHM